MVGVQSIIRRIMESDAKSPSQFVDACLDLIGPLDVTETTRRELITLAEQQGGDLRWDTEGGFQKVRPEGR